MAGSRFSFYGYRRNQLFYGTVLILGIVACASSATIRRFKDIQFSGDQLTSYNDLISTTPASLFTNLGLAIVAASLLAADLFRSRAIPVWVELTWSALFAAMEIANIALVSQHTPSNHCSPPTTASSSLSVATKRDSVAEDGINSYVNFQTGPNAEKIKADASKMICTNWTIMSIFFVVISVLLLSNIIWLVIVGFVHRKSHPSFFWTAETPKPYTWTLDESTATSSDAASVSSSSTFDAKKAVSTQPSILPSFNEKEQQQKQVQPKIGYYSFAEGKWM